MADVLDQPTEASEQLAADASPSHVFRWLVTRVGTRAAAAVWWLVMILFDLLIIGWWVSLLRDPTLADAVLVVGLTLIAGVPLVHEWPNARRMGRLLIKGT